LFCKSHPGFDLGFRATEGDPETSSG